MGPGEDAEMAGESPVRECAVGEAESYSDILVMHCYCHLFHSSLIYPYRDYWFVFLYRIARNFLFLPHIVYS